MRRSGLARRWLAAALLPPDLTDAIEPGPVRKPSSDDDVRFRKSVTVGCLGINFGFGTRARAPS